MDNYTEILRNCRESGGFCERDFILADKTSMKIGGECDVFVAPKTEKSLCEILDFCRKSGISYFVLGKGSNVLINKFHGVVISTAELCEISADGRTITAGAGASLAAVCKTALEKSLTGMECLFGIPGSVGGALFMNAGAYGGEMKDVVSSCRYIDEDGEIREMRAEEMELCYRGSIFRQRDFVIISVVFTLNEGEKTAIKERMEELMQRRRDKQPLEYPSCGSTFKRPENYFAAALIEECGLKGCSVGGAEVSRKHSGFVINKGGATFEDVVALVEHIKKVVREEKGVELECEMIIVDK
ncbi:MAG: UDP-N-acetylmuramate dehydrogenase [Oscillospiraceae bacterium]|nr:UDP-N-acetylmuramate dehydrogenase [Oscillospiraceae bacterium]